MTVVIVQAYCTVYASSVPSNYIIATDDNDENAGLENKTLIDNNLSIIFNREHNLTPFVYNEMEAKALRIINKNLSLTSAIATEVDPQEKEDYKLKKITNEKSVADATQQGGLIDIKTPDENYDKIVVNITGENRSLLERLVMGEAGGEGFEGACLVAQAIKDTMVFKDNYSVNYIIKTYKYTGRTDKKPNQDSIDAVKYIFDDGGYAVKHRIIYFYAKSLVKNNVSKFHESQNFIIELKGHRFFDMVN